MSDKTTVYDCSIINLPSSGNRNGKITHVDNNEHIPFTIKRVFYLYDVQSGQSRGAHAHIHCHQLLVAASGAFDVLLNDGMSEKIVHLNRPGVGLHIPPGIWASEMNFSSGSICLVLASHYYDEADYIRNEKNYKDYKSWK